MPQAANSAQISANTADNTMLLTLTADDGSTVTISLGAEVVKGIGFSAHFHGVKPSPYTQDGSLPIERDSPAPLLDSDRPATE